MFVAFVRGKVRLEVLDHFEDKSARCRLVIVAVGDGIDNTLHIFLAQVLRHVRSARARARVCVCASSSVVQ